MSPSKKIAIGSILCVLLSGTSAFAQNVIQNGSFEAPVRGNAYTFMGVGDDMDGVWFITAVTNDVGHVRHHPGFASIDPYPDGDQMVYLGDSASAATMVQPIATPLTATSYALSFYLATTNNNDIATVRVELAPITGGSGLSTTYGAAVYGQTFDVGGVGINAMWHHVTDTITVPSAGSYGLFFISFNDAHQANIDNVSLAVPEPASVSAIALACVMLGRRSRNR